MAYVPTNWQTGDVITAEKLNHAENAIGALYVTSTDEDNVKTLSASYNDILSAHNAGKTIAYVVNSDGTLFLYYLTLLSKGELNDCTAIFGIGDNSYTFTSEDDDSNMEYTADES